MSSHCGRWPPEAKRVAPIFRSRGTDPREKWRLTRINCKLANEGCQNFQEKPAGDGAWINGGFFVLNPETIDAIEGDATSWENGPLQEFARKKQLVAYQQHGFWQAMDTLRDKNQLEELWNSGKALWKVWP